MLLSRETVLNSLAKIKDPVSGNDLVSANLIKALNIKSNEVSFLIEISSSQEQEYIEIKLLAEAEIKKLKKDLIVKVFLTAHKLSSKSEPTPQTPNLKIGRHPEPQKAKIKPPGVNKIIAIGSGKGGVGKSTLSANIAVALSQRGLKVGLLDADIYGPSQPKLMGVSGKPKIGGADGKSILPLHAYGITLMSMGFLVAEDEAVVWRGPMLMGALQQFIGQVEWGELDILLIDLPPGTGDVQLTLAQKCELDGAVIVSTPQDVALIDARKAMQMFYKLDVPILGMIENMSTFVCTNCGHEEHLFGKGGVQAEAERAQLNFLGEVPLDIKVRQSSDLGKPIVFSDFESIQSSAFVRIADRLSAKLSLS
jgi:ATP-binding protein involved in chromosome partitioning